MVRFRKVCLYQTHSHQLLSKYKLNTHESQNFYRYSQFKDKLLQLANELGDRAKISNLTARTITLEIKTFEYKTHRRSKTTSEFIGTHKDFIKFGLKLLDEMWPVSIKSYFLNF